MNNGDAPLSKRLEAMAESDLIPMEDACNLLREAAELARRVEGAATGFVRNAGWTYADVRIDDEFVRRQSEYLQGKRVRLVPEVN